MARHGVLTPGRVPPFRGRDWTEIRDWFGELGWPELQPLIDVVESALACGGAERLVATTSMHDLWVSCPGGDGFSSGLDLIKVRAFTSIRPVADGEVLIDYTSPSGQDESIARPADGTVSLFWRFAKEKWGIEPWRWESMDQARRHALMLASQAVELHDLWEARWPNDVVNKDRYHEPGLVAAQRDVVELLRLGVVQVIVVDGPAERGASDEDLAGLFGPARRPPGGGSQARLVLTPAGASWYRRASQRD